MLDTLTSLNLGEVGSFLSDDYQQVLGVPWGHRPGQIGQGKLCWVDPRARAGMTKLDMNVQEQKAILNPTD